MKKIFVFFNLLLFYIVVNSQAAEISSPDRFEKNKNMFNAYLRYCWFDTQVENEAVEALLGELPTGNKLGAMAIGGLFDFNSKYYGGFIGVDASIYAVGKLDSKKESRGILKEESDGNNVSFAKIGQLYIKMKHEAQNWSVDTQIGRGRFDAASISTLDTRVAPSSYQGMRAHFNVKNFSVWKFPGNFTLEGAYINRTSYYDTDKFEYLYSESGQTIDSVVTYGAILDLKAVELVLAQGIAKDFNINTSLGLTLKAPLGDNGGIMLDTKLFKYKANGKIWETDLVAGDAAYDDEAKLYNVNLGASYKSSFGKFRFGLSYTKCDAELSTFTSFGTPMLGYAYLDHAENMASRREAWTISGNDFNNEGEQAWQIAVEYRLPSSLGKNITPFPLDDITFMFIYKEGFFDALNPLPLLSGGIPIMTDIKERQAEYRAYYRFDEEKYSGVSIGMAFIDYRINEDFVALVSAQPNNVMTGREFRLYIDYAF